MKVYRKQKGSTLIMAVFFLSLMAFLGTFIFKISYQHFLFVNQIEKSCYWEENYDAVALMSIEWIAEEIAFLQKNKLQDNLEREIYLYLLYQKNFDKVQVEVRNLEGYLQIKFRYRDNYTSEGQLHYCILNILKSGENDEAYKILEAGIIPEERLYAD